MPKGAPYGGRTTRNDAGGVAAETADTRLGFLGITMVRHVFWVDDIVSGLSAPSFLCQFGRSAAGLALYSALFMLLPFV